MKRTTNRPNQITATKPENLAMKINAILSCCAALLLGALASLHAADPVVPPAKPGSAEFERMKTLIGTWKGMADCGQGPQELTVQYRLLAGGSVLEERVFQNTPMEMVTMYYDKEGKLALTHYCVMGNRPAMAMKASDAKSITFDFDGSCCTIDPKKESHMHGMTLRFDDADTITTSCVSMMEGKEVTTHPATLKRVATAAAR